MAQSEVDSGWDFISQQLPNAAVATLFGDEDGDPKLAAQSVKLAADTGVPASVIHTDPDRFLKNQMTQWSSEIIRSNPHLQSFLTNDPMAAKVAKNDIASLDKASQAIQKLAKDKIEGLASDELLTRIVPAMWHGANEGFGPQPMLEWMQTPTFQELNPASRAAWTILGYPVEAVFRTINAGVKAAAEGSRVTASDVYNSITGDRMAADRFGRDIGGMVEAEMMGMSGRGHAPKRAEIQRGVSETVLGIKGKDFQEAMKEGRTRQQDIFWEARQELESLRSWIDGGEEPPPGVSPWLDKIREKQSRDSLRDLEDAGKESDGTETKELSKDTYKDFVKQHETAAVEINADAVAKLYGDAVPAVDDGILGHVPTIGDNLETALAAGGDVTIPMHEWLALDPEIRKALKDDVRTRPGLLTANEIKDKAFESKEAEPTIPPPTPDMVRFYHGHDEEAPPNTGGGRWVTTDPQYARDFRSDGRPKNVSYVDVPKDHPSEVAARMWDEIDEAGQTNMVGRYRHIELPEELAMQMKPYSSPKAPPLQEPLPQVRSAAGLEPMFGVGDRKVTLKRLKAKKDTGALGDFHDFDLIDENGKTIGNINLSLQKGGEDLYIEMINAGPQEKKFYDPNFLGPALIRDLFRQLREEFPDAKWLTGHRVSGAREKANTFYEPHAMWRLPLAKFYTPEAIRTFREGLKEGYWQEQSQGFEALIKPNEEWSGKEQRIAQALQEETRRLVPGVETQEAFGIRRADRPAEDTRALYDPMGFGSFLPRIIIDLNTENPLGVLRHEAIHHLKEFGLITKDEWATLERAAKEEGWIEKYNIDKRYPSLGAEAKLEEAIAEGFKHWKDGELIVKDTGAFQRMKDFFESLYRRIKEIIGRDFTWEEIFKEIDEGKVGRREPDSMAFGGVMKRSAADSRHFNSIRAAEFRLGQLLRDKAASKKAGVDVESSDYSYYNAQIRELREFIKNPEAGRPSLKSSAGEGPKPPPLPKQGELDVTRMEDREPFKAGAMTPVMTADMQQRYMKLINERNEADLEAATKRAQRLEKAKQTKEWKRSREEMRVEVEKEINRRPDVAADLFFSRGEYDGKRLGGRPKIDPESLTPELRERLKNTDWIKKDGLNAEDAANLFGFRTPEEMFDALAEYQAQRPEGIGAKRQRDAIVEKETDRQMELRYGRLEDNIIAEARDQAASETQLQILHEETFFLASQAKAEFSLTREQMRQWAEDQFGKSTYADMTSTKWFQTSGKHGRAAEEALLKGKAKEAFIAKQQQYFALSLAQQAIKLEKERAQFQKTIERLKKREVKGIDREFVDFAQELLIGSGIKLRVTMDEVRASKLFHGNVSLREFAVEGLGKGWGLDAEISPELQAGMFKNINSMTVNDFRDLKDAVDALTFAGRRVNKIFAQGRLAEKKAVVDSIIANLVQRPKLDPDKELGNIHKLMAATKRPEQIIKDLDDHAELGPAFRNLWEPLTIAAAKFLQLEKDLTARIQQMTTGNKAWMKTLGEQIPNDFFYDPHDGTLFNLNRGHLVRIMLNWGNEGNIKKFVEGWAAYDKPTKAEVANFRSKMEELIQRHARPEDWAYVRDVWDIFQGWQSELDTVHRNTSGKLPKWVRPDSIKLPDGTTISEGGYFPLIPDKTRLIPGTGFDPLPNIKNGVMQRDYFRPTTTKTHMMERQINAKYRVQFLGDMGEVALRMQQVMHDIAYREGMMDVSGLLADKRLRNAIKERYSPEYLKQLDAWLVRQANYLNYDEIAMGGMNNILQRVRGNLVAYALPLNLNVILSPALGLTHPIQWARTLWDFDSMRKLAEEHSRVIPHTEYNLDRDFREHIEGLSRKHGWDRLRTEATKRAYYPMILLEQRLRTVTFYSEFNKAKERGLSDYDASQVADSAVRERHGAQTLTDLPTVMASNEGYKMMTVFMGYFNTMDNWSRQIPGQVRRGEYMKALETAWGAIIVPAIFGGILFNKAKEDDSYWKIAAKAVGLQMTQGIPFFREAASMVTEGYKPTTPLASVLDGLYQTAKDGYRAAGQVPGVRDMMKAVGIAPKVGPQGNVIRHLSTAIGTGLGVPGTLQAGKTGQFLYDYSKGKQRPRDIWEWMRGLRTGEARLKKGS